MNDVSISSSAMLVELSIPSWAGTKRDKKVSEEVRASKGAAKNAATVTKVLFPNEPIFKNVGTVRGAARNHNYALTLPWYDRGPRMLVTSAYPKHVEAMSEHKLLFEEARDAFLKEYPKMVARAASRTDRLGDLFDPEDYPDIDVLRASFDFRLEYSRMPDAPDSRLDIPKAALRDMQAAHENGMRIRLDEAYRDAWDRVHKCLSNFSEKLGKEEGKSRVHDSLIGNIVEMIDMLDAFNITGDPRLTQAQQALRHAITMPNGTILTPDQVREASPTTKAETKARVDALLDNMSW